MSEQVEAFSVALNEPMRDALSALLDDSMAMDEAGGQCVLEIDATGCLTANGYLLDREGEWVSPTVSNSQPTKETYTREQLADLTAEQIAGVLLTLATAERERAERAGIRPGVREIYVRRQEALEAAIEHVRAVLEPRASTGGER